MTEERLKEIREILEAPACAGLVSDVWDMAEELLALTKSQEEENARLREGMELAWGLISNAGTGNWSFETAEWQREAARWRDENWHPALDRAKAAIAQPHPGEENPE